MIRMSEMQSEAIPPLTLGWRLQMSLDHAGVKVADMADELGAARSTVSRWLNDRGPVRDIYLKQWALRCGVPYSWLKEGQTLGAPTIPRSWGDSEITLACVALAS